MKWAILGVPSSIGARNTGPEKAPAALRRAGLAERLRSAGLPVEDTGDTPAMPFRPDPEPSRKTHQNLGGVREMAQTVAPRVEAILRSGRHLLVLGGDCTVAIGAFAGASRVHPDLGLAYFDRDAELNTPRTTRTGILDGMVVAHLLGRGARDLAGLEARFPLLRPGRLALLGVERFDPPEVPVFEALPSLRIRSGELRGTGPDRIAEEILLRLAGEGETFYVHLDLDVLDGAEMPAVDFPAPDGLGLGAAAVLLGKLAASPGFTGLEVTNFNPDRDPNGRSAERVVDLLARSLSGGR